jgi:hypothetical protein
VPPSPVKRYRQKSRLRRGDAGAELRQRALEMAQKGLNRRGGPVDKGSPAAQVQAAKPMQGTKKVARDNQMKQRAAFEHARTGLLRRSPKPRASLPMLRRPASSRTTGPTEGTGNRTKPANRGSHDLANELARQRATQNRPKARRKLFSRA